MKKKLSVLCLAAVMSLSFTGLSYGTQWQKQADGSYKSWQEDKNLNEDSGYYNVHNYKWEQQADGTWKAYHTHDYWRVMCNCSFGHLSDPKYTCPGRLEHEEGWLTGRQYINGAAYIFDENGIMLSDLWMPYKEMTNDKGTYMDAVYVYYGQSGDRLRGTTVDGKVIDRAGFWYDPSIVPYGNDGRFNLEKMDWTGGIPYLIAEKIAADFTKDELMAAFRKLPEYTGEIVKENGYIELQFTDYRIASNLQMLYIWYGDKEINNLYYELSYK